MVFYMEFRENPAFGRRIFFINPPFSVEKRIIEWLKALEYEVYIIRDYTGAKNVLRNHENAICFINIDQQLSLKGWYNFIKSFETDPTLQTVFLGIVSTHATEAQVSKFLMNLKLPGGYVSLHEEPEALLKKFVGILDINGAKGSRKYVLLDCNGVYTVNGYIAHGTKLYDMHIEEISSVGISCSFDPSISFVFQKNTILQNVSLSLGRFSVITQCVVYEAKTLKDKNIALLLFVKETPKEIKNSIRGYIFDILSKRMNDFISRSAADPVNYENMLPVGDASAVPDYNAPTDQDVVADGELEEVESSSDSGATAKDPAGTETSATEADSPDSETAESKASDSDTPASADTEKAPESTPTSAESAESETTESNPTTSETETPVEK